MTKPYLPWHKPEDLDKLEPHRDPPEGAKCGSAVEASNRSRVGDVGGKRAEGGKASEAAVFVVTTPSVIRIPRL
jgi:hypothetical protein